MEEEGMLRDADIVLMQFYRQKTPNARMSLVASFSNAANNLLPIIDACHFVITPRWMPYFIAHSIAAPPLVNTASRYYDVAKSPPSFA